jgi:hypothetical protein
MCETAYIAIADDGHLTLFWGDGTEDQQYVILQGPPAPLGQELVEVIEELKAWAEDNGYEVIVPAYDLKAPDVEIDLPDEEAETIDLDDVDALLDDVYFAGDYQDENIDEGDEY